jgi:pyruvate dehydrogenase kinase 2/3/4
LEFEKVELPEEVRKLFKNSGRNEDDIVRLETSRPNPDLPPSYRKNGSLSLSHR